MSYTSSPLNQNFNFTSPNYCQGSNANTPNSTGKDDRFIPKRSSTCLNFKFRQGNKKPRDEILSNQTKSKNVCPEEQRLTQQALLASQIQNQSQNPNVINNNQINNENIMPQVNINYDNYLTTPILSFNNSINNAQSQRNLFKLSPLSPLDPQIVLNELQDRRSIPKVPYKVLDAPSLLDDYQLNLLDWSSSNRLAVGLSNCVQLWSPITSKVTQLCNLGSDAVTSVNWTLDGSHLAVGTGGGDVQIWDLEASSKIRTMQGHTQRVGALAWNNPVLSSGSRDRTILQRDIRSKFDFEMQLTAHRQEVCGLKWSFDNQQLASGGNDNKLFIWTLNSSQPMAKFQSHTAAVKAIAWSPHQHGLLVSGGGTADRCIRFWNTLSCKALSAIDTGSQVCNLMFSKNVNELVSTHGYSQHQIAIWQLPGMKKIASLTGHTSRVLQLAMSPDGQTIVTGAGDETLRFWHAFPLKKCSNEENYSSVKPSPQDLR